MVKNLENIKKFFLKSIVGIRRFGSAALDLCNVASGRATAFWEFNLNPWDFAAGASIIKEAGGEFTDLDGKPATPKTVGYIASNRLMHPKIGATFFNLT